MTAVEANGRVARPAGRALSRTLVLELAFLMMEALAFFVVGATVVGAAGREGASFPLYFAAEAGGFFLVRGLLRFDLPARALVVAGGLITLLCLITIAGLAFAPASFPPGWEGVVRFLGSPGDALGSADAKVTYGVILLAVVWGRGVWAAQERLERSRALRSFSLGLVVLTAGLLFGRDSPASGAVNGASLPLVAFGLLTLALIHLREARPAAGDALRGPWLLITSGAVGGLVLGGAALGVLPLGPGGWLYDHAIEPALSLALTALAFVLLVFAYPFAWLLATILNSLMSGSHFKPPDPVQSASPRGDLLLGTHKDGHAAAIFLVLFKLIAILLIVALIAYIAYRLFNRLHRPPAEDEERESLAAEGSLGADLASLLRHLLPRRRSHAAEVEPDLPPGVLHARRLYLRLLRLAAVRGHPRPPSATPLEFAPEATRVLASVVPTEVTDAFVAARYGRQEPSPAELRRLQDAVDRLG